MSTRSPPSPSSVSNAFINRSSFVYFVKSFYIRYIDTYIYPCARSHGTMEIRISLLHLPTHPRTCLPTYTSTFIHTYINRDPPPPSDTRVSAAFHHVRSRSTTYTYTAVFRPSAGLSYSRLLFAGGPRAVFDGIPRGFILIAVCVVPGTE
jgi:hypothetical protein